MFLEEDMEVLAKVNGLWLVGLKIVYYVLFLRLKSGKRFRDLSGANI